MNNFLENLKGDLLDRRLRPIVALVVVGLLGALAFAALGGSSETVPPVKATQPLPVALTSGVSITPSVREDALAETTSGSTRQLGGARDPFGASLSASATTTGSSSSAASSSSESSSGASTVGSSSSPSSSGASTETSGSSGGSSGSSKPAAPSKPKTVYQLDVLFGEVVSGAEKSSQLAALDNIKTLTPLPSIKVPLLIYRGVRKGGKDATFTVSGEAILSGPGTCKPSPYDCEAISLKTGQAEHVQYLPTGSETAVTYELKVASIQAQEASIAEVESLWRGQSQAGLQVLRSANLLRVPGLRNTGVAGVLVPAG
jgi:hypothetical protein